MTPEHKKMAVEAVILDANISRQKAEIAVDAVLDVQRRTSEAWRWHMPARKSPKSG